MNSSSENPEANDFEMDAQNVDSQSADTDNANAEIEVPPRNSDPDATAETQPKDLQAQLADAEKRVLLAHADLENFRRRTRRDHEEQLKYATLPLMSELLDVLDNFDRAIEAHETDSAGKGLLEGVKMVRQQIADLLTRRGCKKIDAVGQTFDPNRHQALQMQPSDDFDNNVVMMDLRPGFELHDRVVRPSQVFVSTGPAAKE